MLLGATGRSHTHKGDHHNLLIHSVLLGAIGCSLTHKADHHIHSEDVPLVSRVDVLCVYLHAR